MVNSSKGHCARADGEILTDVPASVIVSVMRQRCESIFGHPEVLSFKCHTKAPALGGITGDDKLGRRVKEKVRLCCFWAAQSVILNYFELQIALLRHFVVVMVLDLRQVCFFC